MEVRLSPEIAAAVERGIASGRYASAEEYVADAVVELDEREQWRDETLEETRTSLEAAWQESERGELIPLDEARRQLVEMKAEWRANRRSA
jgi:Arc/MetJ-type ribon-helix-helix transcriptional regulator